MTNVSPLRALLGAWATLAFFADARRTGGSGSSLTTTVFTQAFLGLVFAALLHGDTPPIAYAAANLSLSTLLVGIGALGDETLLGRADDVLLATAPVRPRTIVLARAIHGLFRLGIVTIGMALPAAILFAFSVGQPLAAPAYLVAAVFCAGLMSGGLATALRVLAAAIGVARAQLAAGTTKAALLGFGVAGFALGMRRLRGTIADLPLADLAQYWPPYLAARVLVSPANALDAVVILAGALAVVFAVATAVSRVRREVASRHMPSRGLLRRLLLRSVGAGPERAFADFTATMLLRSPGFRSRVLPLFGIPIAMVALAANTAAPSTTPLLAGVALQFPAIFLPFLVAFLPRADQAHVDWVFTTSPTPDLGLARRAARVALVICVLVPTIVVAAATTVLLGIDVRTVLFCSVLAFATGVFVADFSTARLPCLPFTDSVDRPETALDFGPLMVGAFVLTGLGAGGAALAGSIAAVPVGVVLAFAAWRRLLRPPDVVDTQAETALRPVEIASGSMPSTGPRAEDAGQRPPTAVRRELLAMVTLYGAISVLPVLIGLLS